jgi:RNA polymerase sigma-70 factor (ECF subfamily)
MAPRVAALADEGDLPVPEPQDTPQPSMEGGTSLTLLVRLRANEAAAWDTMVHLYRPLVCHWCLRAGLQGADADDIAQEVFQAAATHLEQFRRDRPGDSFRAWLRGITRNKILLHFRRHGRHAPARGGTDAFIQLQELADEPDPIGADDSASETDGLFQRALDLVRGEFEARTWQMFWATTAEGRSPVDVAADLGVTPGTVRKAKARVLHRLREEFGDLIQ